MLNKMSSLWRCLYVVLLLIAVSPLLRAQTAATGALSGTVTDQSSSVVPNVTVTATSTDTGQTRTATTNGDGTYKIGLLTPGNYRVQFEASGFKTVAVPNITVTVTETAVLDRLLEVGSQSQEVTVQGEVEAAIQTSDATVGAVLTGRTIVEIPLTTRNYTNVLGLAAGANVGVYNATNVGRGTQDIAVNGGSTTQNNFQMDGVSINVAGGSGAAGDAGGNAGIGIANPDAIQEFKIQTSLFDAGYGHKPGASVNVITKSGTNQFHGTAFEFFRNTALNANDFFRNQSPPVNGVPNNSRQVLNANQFGGVFGGPVKKDKLFFFASYQETRQKNGAANPGYSSPFLLPIFPGGDRSNTAALRQALGSTFCPVVGTDGGSTSNGGTQVACDGSNINQVAINLLQLKNADGTYYIPSSGPITGNGTKTLAQNTTFSIPSTYAEHQGLGNVDYIINSKQALAIRWFFSTEPSIAPIGCAVGQAAGTAPSICLPNTAGFTQYGDQSAIVKLTSIITNSFVNEARISMQRNGIDLGSLSPITNSQVGIASINPAINNLDQITINGLFSAGTYFNLGSSKRVTALGAGDQISWSHGKHTVRAGFEVNDMRSNGALPSDQIGALTFQTFQDFLIGLPGCAPGGPCGAGTNGTPTSNIANSGTFAVQSINGVSIQFRQAWGSAFAEDDIKVNQRLTLNLGLRWEYSPTFISATGQLVNAWPSLMNTVPIPGSTPATGTLAGFVTASNYNPAINPVPPVGGVYQNDKKAGTRNGTPLTDFAPRIGLAWRPTGSDKLAVRSGFGYFYDFLSIANASTTYYIAQPYSILVSQSGQANYYSSLAQPYPTGPPQWSPRWVNFTTGTSSNLSEYVQEEKYLTPLVYEWNANVQYEFLPSWILEVGYVGSHGIHQNTSNLQQLNQAQLVGSPGATAPAIVGQLIQGCNYSTGAGCNTVANASLRVPYLGFAPGGLTVGGTEASSKFNGLQATVRKQFNHGFTVQGAYSWSKSLANGNLNINDANNYGSQYGLNSSYRPQRFALNYSWDLPFGHPQGWESKLVTGWTVSGVTIVQDGSPLTITDSRGGSVYGFGAGAKEVSTAEFCPGGSAANAASSGSDKARLGDWFNSAVFNTSCAPPVLGSDGKATGYGNSGIGILLGPGQFNWDISATKLTTVGGIREGATLQFRTEFFNAFNHAQFNNPALNASVSTLGQITSASVNPRLLQFALKYAF